jgi:hypothetical protein
MPNTENRIRGVNQVLSSVFGIRFLVVAGPHPRSAAPRLEDSLVAAAAGARLSALVKTRNDELSR